MLRRSRRKTQRQLRPPCESHLFPLALTAAVARTTDHMQRHGLRLPLVPYPVCRSLRVFTASRKGSWGARTTLSLRALWQVVFAYSRQRSLTVAESKEIAVEDPQLCHTHQIYNFLRFCELAVRFRVCKKITLTTSYG